MTGEIENTGPDTPGKPPPAKKRRRVWWRVVGLLLLAPVVFACVAAFMMIGREVSAPGWMVAQVETRATELLAGGEVGFGEVTLTVGQDLHPRLVLRNTVLSDGTGAVIARVPRIEGLFSPRGILKGRVLPQEIDLHGAQLQLRRQADGAVALTFGQSNTEIQSAGSFLDLLDQVNDAFETGPLEALEVVRAEGLIINYSDAHAARNWIVDSGRAELSLNRTETVMRADIALLSGRDYVTTAEFTYRSARDGSAGDFGIIIEEAAAPDFASQIPLLSFLGVVEAPLSGAMRGTLNEAGQLSEMSATLQLGAGELRPNAQTRPISFDGARTYLTFDPSRQKINFDLVEVQSEWGSVEANGQAYLADFDGIWPSAILGQIDVTSLLVNPDGLYPETRDIGRGNADFRLRLDPFGVDIGQLVLENAGAPVHVSGQIGAETDGWTMSLMAQADTLETRRVLELWPEALSSGTRIWLDENILGGSLRNIAMGLRAEPGAQPEISTTMEFEDATIRYMPQQPPIENASGLYANSQKRVSLQLFQGNVSAPDGGQLALAGSTMVVPQTGPGAQAEFDLQIQGTITAAMSLLATEPFSILRNSDLSPSFADGRARVLVDLDMPLGPDVQPEQRIWSAEAELSRVRSTELVPDRVLSATALRLRADSSSVVVQGPVRMDDIPAQIVFSRGIGAGSEGTARLSADLTLSPQVLSALNIGLSPGSVSGEGPGQLEMAFRNAGAPEFSVSSTLRGIALSLPQVGWQKPASSAGTLRVEGVLGASPRIDNLSIEASGLAARGQISIAPGGGLERAEFDRFQVGDWFDAPVTLTGTGAGRPLDIAIPGGVIDLRRADFGDGGQGSGAGGPITLALDRLQVSQGIVLTGFRGDFTTSGGFAGAFQAQVNGAAPIRGTVVPINERSGVRIQSNDAGAVYRAASLLRNAHGGTLDLTLRPTGQEGHYDGTMVAREVRVRDAPALASLLDAISVVGLLTQLGGQGLLFTDVDATFRLTPDQVIVNQSSAIGPGLGVSLDGIYDLASARMDFQGVISPIYLLNGIGSILTRPGEGLFGFNFNLQGPVDSPRVLVNPLSALTPGMFRDIFRRPPPQ